MQNKLCSKNKVLLSFRSSQVSQLIFDIALFAFWSIWTKEASADLKVGLSKMLLHNRHYKHHSFFLPEHVRQFFH